MRSLTFVFIIATLFAIVLAYPDASHHDEITADEAVQGVELIKSNRFKRATCDIVPGILQGIGHAACGAHCVSKGFRGGWCDSRAVCNCRH